MLQAVFGYFHIGFYWWDLICSILLIISQESNAIYKIQLRDHHYQINRVEIPFTAKASGQVGCRINGRIEFIA